jgi:hypothetical protein
MGLFDKFSKDKNTQGLPDILSIPCDYNGYDLIFEEEMTNPVVYSDITALITNNNVDVNEIEGYDELERNTPEEEFYDFFDNWIEALDEKRFIAELFPNVGISTFVADINQVLGNIGSSQLLDVDETVNAYRAEVVKYSFKGKHVDADFAYDVLEANIVASRLRKIGYELIAIFNGVDNDAKAVIPLDKIPLMQELESRIK